ncbi:MAG: hypothetical protein KKH12_10195 [Gammaproteobacteria bacterium]|nr:hypothetical protein [Gammaproteobacteria bacterium]
MTNRIGQLMGTNIVEKFQNLFVIALVVSILCSCTTQQDTADVDRFVDRRDRCDHMAGEIPDPPNPERMKEVIDGIDKYCTGTDAELAALKLRYANNPAIMDKLNQYEPHVERKKRTQ